jgi:hypothetical protein
VQIFAQTSESGEQNKQNSKIISSEPGVIPGMLSIFPGFIIRGSGHYFMGEKDTALDLLLLEGMSLLGFVGSTYATYETGASRKTIGLFLPLMTTGATLFVYSWFADIFGSLTGGYDYQLDRKEKYLSFSNGVRYIYDPLFEYRNFFQTKLKVKYHALNLSSQNWIALDDDNQRHILSASIDLLGHYGIFTKELKDTLRLSFTNRYGYHKFGTEKFSKKWVDFSITGKLENGGLWKSLSGSFINFEYGYNAEWVKFLISDDIPQDYTEQFLFKAGFGFYLVHERNVIGDIVVYYNHRKDDFVGGFPSGFMGFIGMDCNFKINSFLKSKVEIQYGSAFLLGLELGVIF